jgi:hypothetical protein
VLDVRVSFVIGIRNFKYNSHCGYWNWKKVIGLRDRVCEMKSR